MMRSTGYQAVAPGDVFANSLRIFLVFLKSFSQLPKRPGFVLFEAFLVDENKIILIRLTGLD